MISSREFLQDAGVSLAGPPDAPAEVRHLLITAALTCVTGPVTARILIKTGREVSSRTVANWLQSTRVWLGLPPANRGKRSRKYRRELEEWHRINGHPTADEIDGGWIPAHRRSPQQANSPPAAATKLPECTPVAAVPAQPASPAPRSSNSMHGDECQGTGETPQTPKTDWAEEARKTAEFAKQPQPNPRTTPPPLPEFKKPRATANMLTATPVEIESYAAAMRTEVAAYRAEARKLGYEIADTWTGHGRFNVATAVRIARELERFDILWFEEPVPPDNLDALLEVKQRCRVPIAAGERLYSRWEASTFLEKKCADFIQPDVSHCGGIGELKKIAAMAEARHIAVCPHNPSGPVANAATLQIAACTPNFFIHETMAVDVPWRKEVCDEKVVFGQGRMSIPDAPGLGIELNESAIAEHPYEARDLRHYAGTLTDIRPADATDYLKS